MDDECRRRIRAARERLERAEAVSEKAFAAWLARRDDETTEAFRAALVEQAAAVKELAGLAKKANGLDES